MPPGEGGEASPTSPYRGMNERLLVRIFVGIALGLAILAFVFLPIPVGADEEPVLPALALQQPVLYRMEVGLAAFYGGLLILTPAFAGLVRGQLPIEISARGARFADSADDAFDNLEKTVASLTKKLSLVAQDVESLKRAVDDKAERPLISEP